jgi:hypothetical protein
MRWIVLTMLVFTVLIVVLAVMIGSSLGGGGKHQKRVPRLRQGQPDQTSLVISVRVPT